MNKYALWLFLVDGITSTRIHYLLKTFSCAQEIYSLSKEQLLKCEGVDEKLAEKMIESKKSWDLEYEAERLEERGIFFISEEEEEYPQRLLRIANAPYGIFYKGSLPDPAKKAVSIVGARGRSAYGKQVAEKIAKELALRNVNVISGLALGIDADAHKGALAAKGTTYGVLGCGVDICYPNQNQYLYDEILKNGGILSEYPPKISPKQYMFPARNRIIAGLCDCLIVIEAREKSGSLITADFAMEQGKDVFALPGRITDPLSAGTNRLIKQGAGVLYNIEDFLKEWDLFDASSALQMDFRKNVLEKDELLVYSLLDFCPVGIGTLCDKSSLPILTLFEILERLQQKGFVKEIIPNYFVQTV